MTLDIKLSRLNFQLQPDEYIQEVVEAISHAKSTLDQLSAAKDCSFATILVPLALMEGEFRTRTAVASFLHYVTPDEALRKASLEASKLIDEFEIEKAMHRGLFAAVQSVLARGEPLNGEPKRLLEKVHTGFLRNGLALSEGDSERLGHIKRRLAQLQLEFNKNMNEENSHILLSKSDLEGCSETFLGTLERPEGSPDAYYSLSLKYPDAFGVLGMARKRETREKMYKAFHSRCSENIPVLAEAVRLRHEAARLLGYENHVDFQLQDRMAKYHATILKFQQNLRGKLSELALKELEVLAKLKKQDKDEEPFDWIDFFFYHNVLLRQAYSVDQEQVKEYFSVDKVVPEMLRMYEEVLGLQFELIPSNNTWHSDILGFQVNDRESGESMGILYLDLHPRLGKYSHADCFPLQPGYRLVSGEYQKPVVAILANFSKRTELKPSLLEFNELVVLFHELGHAMHCLCSVTLYSRFQGKNVERDFLEAPSQILENWIWDAEMLERLSCHYQTDSKMPRDMIRKVIATRNVTAGLLNLRQLFFGIFDVSLHLGEGDHEGADQLYRQLKEEVTLLTEPQGLCTSAAFWHMMAGYDVGYYGYLWSQVYSADMFRSRFAREGLLNPQTGQDYRREILLPGGSRDGIDSIRAFLGREPNQHAFLRSIGIEQ